MITNINIRNLAVTDGRELNLNADSPDGYDVRQIEGLTPPPATIASTSNRFLPGTKVTNIKSEVRTITITLEPNPHHQDSAFELRYGLYRHFVPGQRVMLRVDYSNKTSRQIEGIVETHEANVFSNEPRSQITLYCEDPYFRDVKETSITCDTRMNSARKLEATIEVDGDVETPLEFILYTGITMEPGQRLSSIYVDLSSPWMGSTSLRQFRLNGMERLGPSRYDSYIITSHVGNKRAFKRRGDVEHSLLGYLSLSAEWPILTPGENRLEVQTTITGPERDLGYPIVRYTTRYSGA